MAASPASSRAPLRCCLLSGGGSRRMGTDKALIPHPEGGSWLQHTLELLAGLGAPVTLCSADPAHREKALALFASTGWPPLVVTCEPHPGDGPLSALHHLMALHQGERLLLCAVDMPWLEATGLAALAAAGEEESARPLVASDGARLHPLLGIYPASAPLTQDLGLWLAAGGRSMQGWLARGPFATLTLDAGQLRNCNQPGDWAALARSPVVSGATQATG